MSVFFHVQSRFGQISFQYMPRKGLTELRSGVIFLLIPSKAVGIKRGEVMKLSTKGRYGLRALIDLAVSSQEEAVSISSIATRQNISEAYLEQLMAKLKKAGLVKSSRGAQGGYKLARPAAEISVGDVLRALEGSLDAVECAGLSEGGCQGGDVCVSKYVWQKINDSIARTVDEIKLDTLMEESRMAKERYYSSHPDVEHPEKCGEKER